MSLEGPKEALPGMVLEKKPRHRDRHEELSSLRCLGTHRKCFVWLEGKAQGVEPWLQFATWRGDFKRHTWNSSQDWPQTCCVAQDDLEFLVHLSPPPSASLCGAGNGFLHADCVLPLPEWYYYYVLSNTDSADRHSLPSELIVPLPLTL